MIIDMEGESSPIIMTLITDNWLPVSISDEPIWSSLVT